MKKIVSTTAAMLLSAALLTAPASAACRPASCGGTISTSCGDIIWKLASKYLTGSCKITSGTPQLPALDIIYPNQTPGSSAQTPSVPDQTPNTPAQTPSTPGTSDETLAFESEVVRLVNEIRASYGLSALSANEELSQVARYKSEDMAANRYFSHESPTYGSPFQMMQTFGISYRTAGENIAYGQQTPEEVVNAWMNSSGHRANILNASYTQIGVGFCSNGYYWTQMFIG